ncbi:hypothetical protein [Paraburkholderia sp. Ac-20347]|uniref:hypothetical protein n=1 Tax=Paraburkholderia sp. Ac-20347 TaxID=2703892 RepID=UPI001980C4F3|nr:hypothetical protein [Paraburkholderia sp. Ac-20347]MBN3807660.1 hypothetical protein [Paraburkholderia sp. Ac-20347]
MKLESGNVRYFGHLKRAWYGEVTLREMPFVDEVGFGVGPLAGNGTFGEMAVRWYQLGAMLCPRLEVFDDGWRTLATFADVIKKLGHVPTSRSVAIVPVAFCALLEGCGFVGRTPVLRRQRDTDGRGPGRDESGGPER